MDVAGALEALESLSSSPSTSASGPLTALLDQHLAVAKERLHAGSDPKRVIEELQASVTRSKKEVEKGLKGWYGALGNLGKAVDKVRPCLFRSRALGACRLKRKGFPTQPRGDKRCIQ